MYKRVILRVQGQFKTTTKYTKIRETNIKTTSAQANFMCQVLQYEKQRESLVLRSSVT